MKATMRSKNQVYSVGNYLMTGKVLGKGHFARVEEATHRIIGKKVAIKIIDLTYIKEEYARRNLHREPRVMAKLRHPCIAALYETMMHGPRLYVVMEAAGGGDLCALVLAARGTRARGLPEVRARSLAAQLVSAVRHMHSRGVVHRDLKMENIMLDASKQYIKIVDFGLSNVWSAGGALRTPCGSLEYAAPELFVDGRKYGPEVDLWSIGVIVYGMVTGGLPFMGAEGGADTKSRPLLRAAIARGFGKKQRAALACSSAECRAFVQRLLEPNVENRMKIEEAARHRWLRRPGMRMRNNPLPNLDPQDNREIYKQISELSGQPVIDVVAEIKADPFGSAAGIYNIKTHLRQMQAVGDLLWDNRPMSPPPCNETNHVASTSTFTSNIQPRNQIFTPKPKQPSPPKPNALDQKPSLPLPSTATTVQNTTQKLSFISASTSTRTLHKPSEQPKTIKRPPLQSPRFSRPLSGTYGLKNPVYNVYENGDCGLNSRLPSIDEHSNIELSDAMRNVTKTTRASCLKKLNVEEERPIRLNSCPNRNGDLKRSDFYRRAGDGLPSWRASGAFNAPPARILLQNNATTIKRASLGNIVSPHSSSNSQCKSERAMPVGWYSTRVATKEPPHLQRLRRTMALK